MSKEYASTTDTRGHPDGLAKLLRTRAQQIEQWPDDREYELHVEAREVRE